MKLLTACCVSILALVALSCSNTKNQDTGPRKIEILFLGHASTHHNSAAFMPMLAAAVAKEGINFTYTDDPDDLNRANLEKYDALMLYANHDEIEPAQEEALLEYVRSGKGFLPIHSASFCFRNSDEFVDMVGAQFKSHETGTFTAEIIKKDHPAVEGVQEFSTWDETYVHDKHAEDRTILMERVEGGHHEPWTWVKNYGQGRVFYTAYGHDERTWNNPGFHALVKKGILWAVGEKVKAQWQAYVSEMPTLVYKDVDNIPNYEKRDPAPQYQEPLSPEEEKKMIQVPEGFHLELFASEPDIINPIAMDWDERGRLWVIETVDYPNTVRNEQGVGDDRIKICEDTDGDGKADKFTVFVNDLNIPTSLTFANGGVIVSQAPDFLFLKDTDGDDVADIREEIITGWGTRDTHAGPSNLKYGIDNHIWGVVGYSGFEGSIANQPFEFGQGLYRFPADVSSFEFISRTSNNTWGLGITEANDIFASTANNTHSVFIAMPNRYIDGVEGIRPVGNKKIDGHYAMHPITDKIRQVDVWGGFTAAAGHSFYTARTYPSFYWGGTAFVCEPTGHLVHIAKIKPNGGGFEEEDGWNLFAGADEWTSPVDAKVGPDGMVWVADWYNFIIQHNPTPTPDRGGYQAEEGDGNAYINPLRDKQHGRIWRVVYNNPQTEDEITSLDKADTDELLEALKNHNMFWRLTAQRLLIERGEQDVFPQLSKIIGSNRLNEQGENFGAVHALWTLHGLGAFQDESNNEALNVAKKALKHSSSAVRKAAIQVIPATQWAKQAILDAELYNDKHPQVRMAAILKIAEMPTSTNTGKLLYDLCKDEFAGRDEWVSRAVYAAAVKHREGFFGAYLADHPNYLEERSEKQTKTDQYAAVSYEDSDWKTMELPGMIEDRGLDVDGVIWFRKEITISPDDFFAAGNIYLGEIDDSDETYINGVKVGSMLDSKDIRRFYSIEEGILKKGKNVIAIKLTDVGGSGGFSSNRIGMFSQEGRVDLSGEWKYLVTKELTRVGKQTVAMIADTFMDNYYQTANSKPDNEQGSNAPTIGRQIEISVVKNQMKYDTESFTVKAGETVQITFENPDFMQHNLLIIKPGTLEKVGAAADALATSSDGVEKDYIPQISEVLFKTKLVDPNKSVTLTFTAPTEAGDYPFVCTFPGHWRIMNGIMKVVPADQAI
ncbi:MAG: ThuA domain-containing protein [Marinoscillum sp.]